MSKYNSLLKEFIRNKIYECVDADIRADVEETVNKIMEYVQKEEGTDGRA